MAKLSQGKRILLALQQADGDWISSRVFKQEMLISEANARISELRNKGYDIETGESDEYGFATHRIKPQKQLTEEEKYELFEPKVVPTPTRIKS